MLPIYLGCVLFGIFITTRLMFIDKQFDTQLDVFSEKAANADKLLNKEISRAKPDKEFVVNFAIQLSTLTNTCNSIKKLSKLNRRQVLIDIAATGFLIIVSIITQIYDYDSILYTPFFITLLFSTVSFCLYSIITFVGQYHCVNRFKDITLD